MIGAIYGLTKGWPMRNPECSLENDSGIPSNTFTLIRNDTYHLALFDPADSKPTLLVDALLFRLGSTCITGLFTSTMIVWLDLNIRFL
jgi:hypothetical protein